MKGKTIFSIRIISTLFVFMIVYYFLLPPLNLTSPNFWYFVIMMILFYFLTGLLKLLDSYHIFKSYEQIVTGTLPHFSIRTYYPYLILPVIILGIITINLICSPIFQAKSYAKRIVVKEDTEFTKDVKPVDYNALPLLDKDSSEKLGDRVMGQMPEFVSQYYVSNLYTQINYQDNIIRVTPLEYMNFVKYITNYKDGIKGYITVNSVTGKVKLKKLDKGMKYMPSAYFNHKLSRKLRFSYPTEIFDQETFELDEKGNPYWVVPTIKYTGVGMKKEITGVVILDPITGKSKKYKVKDVPEWVDHVYSADLLIEQLDDWGMYQKGFINSIFGQKGVVVTTEGYNYTTMNDDVYMYTGVTSIAKDASNIGFIMTNMRTKETHFYKVPGAEEYSAMASAKGQVQQMKYEPTFPLLINLNNRPTYLMSLKDNAGLVKMYAFVDVMDYQKVVVTDASKGIEVASKNYLKDVVLETKEEEQENITITIKELLPVMINGTSYYYITDEDNNRYRASIKINEELLPFLKENDKVEIKYKEEAKLRQITKISEK